jgi:hypothetical protein
MERITSVNRGIIVQAKKICSPAVEFSLTDGLAYSACKQVGME